MTRPVATGLLLVATAVALSGCGTGRSAQRPAPAITPTTDPAGGRSDSTTGSTARPAGSSPAVGDLPGDGPAEVAGVALTDGHLLASEGFTVGWVTTAPIDRAGAVWRRLATATAAAGLVPILIGPDDRGDDSAGEPGVDWLSDELLPAEPPSPGGPSAREVLAGYAAVRFHPARSLGASPANGTASADPVATDAAVDGLPAARVVLVRAARGSEALCVLGWAGNASYDSTTSLATLVRSWEDRFGARVVAIGPRSLTLGIDRPPASPDSAAALADELSLANPNLGWSAEELLDARLWTLRWR